MYKYILVLVLCICTAGTTYAQRGRMMQRYIEKQLSSDAAPTTGPEPAYSDLYYWAASPYKHDPSDSIPAFLQDEVRDSSVDVFFIHPTTYLANDDGDDDVREDIGTNNRRAAFNAMKTTAWNADLSDTALNNATDMRTILYQASVFNGSCRVFAPRYRQASLKAFVVRNSPDAQRAFDLAYADIEHAFQYYLDHYNHGRPIIIASHSQGSLHAIRLLQDFFDGKPLQKRLVAAYVIGYQVKRDAFSNIPVCNSPTATGCVISWRTFQKGTIPKSVQKEKGDAICVNPLTWTTTIGWASKDDDQGSMLGFNKIVPHVVSAGIEPSAHILWVTLPDAAGDKMQKMKNLHVLDYNLFWMNIRQNVRQRIAAYERG